MYALLEVLKKNMKEFPNRNVLVYLFLLTIHPLHSVFIHNLLLYNCLHVFHLSQNSRALLLPLSTIVFSYCRFV